MHVVFFSMVLWIDNDEVVRRATMWKIPFDQWFDYLWFGLQSVSFIQGQFETRVGVHLTWNKVDSHIKAKLQTDPTNVIKGDPLALQLNEAANE